MNHKNFNKLNDRKRRIHHEYEQGKDYFMENYLGRKIRELRRSKDLTQEQLA